MAFFREDVRSSALRQETTDARRRAERADPAERRRRIGYGVLVAGVVGVVVLASLPAPYVIEQPGPVYDTLGTAEHEGDERALISIPDEPTYPTAGTLDLLTVSVLGNPENLPNWFEVASSWFDKSQAVVPVEQIFPPTVTTEQRDQQNQALMTSSQQDAVAAALTQLGIDYPSHVTVAQLIDGSPATGILEPDDEIESVNGTAVATVAELRDQLTANGTATPAALGIVRAGAAQTVEVTPEESESGVVLGIGASETFEFPFEVTIQLDDVGGPSAGMMFALGIMDKLTPGELNGGENVAGTGTIDAAGEVGAIGGIRQKLYGAERAGAEYFLAPESNCGEVVGHVPDGLEVFSVATLADSVAALDAIAAGDTSGVPTCTG